MKARINQSQAAALVALTHEWGTVELVYDYDEYLVMLVHKPTGSERTIITKNGSTRVES